MWLLPLLLACAPEAPVPTGFTCQTAPAFLGRPGAKLVACDALAGFPELVNVALDVEGRREVRTVVLVDGRPLADRGDADGGGGQPLRGHDRAEPAAFDGPAVAVARGRGPGGLRVGVDGAGGGAARAARLRPGLAGRKGWIAGQDGLADAGPEGVG